MAGENTLEAMALISSIPRGRLSALRRSRTSAKVFALPLAAAVLLAAGCASSPDEPDEFVRAAVFAPPVPPFLSGPMSQFLTNNAGFSARVTSSGSAGGVESNQTGQLFGRGHLLLFAMEPPVSAREQTIGDPGFSFLWDVAAGRGYLLCEAMQACAPVSTPVRVAAAGGDTATPQLAGIRQVTEETHVFALGNNSTSVVQVLRAPEFQGFPLRLTATVGGETTIVSVSRVQLSVQPPELFAVPEGFASYSSAEALVDELAARRRELRRKAPIVNPLLLEN